jgi:glucuronoarabinoxylan endo-1,4-beta-xylanase
MKILLLFLLVIMAVPSAFAQSVTVSWTTTYQTMDGFGGETLNSANAQSMSESQAAQFYSPTTGIGMAYIRTRNTGDGGVPDLASLRSAVAQGAKVLLTFQSPPASLKASGSFNYGPATSNGTCFTTSQPLSASYSSYAAYMVNYIKAFQNAHGIPISVVSLQNEPDVFGNSSSDSQTYGDCAWTAQAFHDYILVLGPAFAAAGLSPRLMLPELGEWFDQDLAGICLNDSACAQYVSVVAGHGYEWSGKDKATDGFGVSACCHLATAYPLAAAKGKNLWLSETGGGANYSNGSPVYDASISDAMVWAHNIHDFLTVSGVSGWFYWQLTALSSQGDNFGLTDQNFNPAKRYYAIGNWSKFVRPGWVRIGATTSPQAGVYVSAFKEVSSGKFAVIAINRNSAATDIDFSLSAFPAASSVTPTVTSANDNLADQDAVTLSGSQFSYSLPATSVVTFHGVASTSSSGAPRPPTNLALTIH